MLIDHLVYGAPDLRLAVDDLEARFGVRAQEGGKHVGRGTHNALLALGASTYLEVIAPDPEQPPPKAPRPFGVDDLAAGRLVGWAVSCDDIDAAIAHWGAHDYDPGDAIDMQRISPTGTVLRWRLTANATAGGALPFLISWGDTEHPSRSAPTGLTLDGFEIGAPDSARLTSLLDALAVDVRVVAAERTRLLARISGPNGRQELR